MCLISFDFFAKIVKKTVMYITKKRLLNISRAVRQYFIKKLVTKI